MTTPRVYSVDEAVGLSLDEILGLNREFVNESLVDLISSYKLPRRFVRADGIQLWDEQGNEYLDFLCSYGALALGHNHPEVFEAVDAVRQLPNFFVVAPGALAGALASSLAAIAPGNLQRSFFCNSGSEAVEGALKLARAATGRSRIIAAHEGFHGKSIGALSATGHAPFRKPYEPLLADVRHIPFGDAEALAEALERQQTAAVILEPIQGPAGIVVPPKGYLKDARDLCSQHGALLILDEIQTGLGRTGKMFACEHDDVVPDVICLSKGLSGGVYPIGAYITTDEVWRKAYGTKKTATLHTSTFGGNTFACAAALAAISITVRDDLPSRADELGEKFRSDLAGIANRSDLLKGVRGKGLMVGLDFHQTSNPVTRGLRNQAAAMVSVQMMQRHRILSLYTFTNASVVRLAPPLTVEQQYLDRYLEALDEVLTRTRKFGRLAASTVRTLRLPSRS